MSRRSPLARRLLRWYAFTVVILLVLLGAVLEFALRSLLLEELTRSLTAESRAVAAALAAVPADELQDRAIALGERLETRITVIGPDGVVLADSERDPTTMENHAERPEVVAALSGSVGTDSRTSQTLREPFRYVAIPAEEGRVVRLAVPTSLVAEQLAGIRRVVAPAALAAAVLGVVAVSLVARRIARPVTEATRAAAEIAGGDLEARVPAMTTTELDQLGRAINQVASELGRRIVAEESERRVRDLILAELALGIVLVDGDDRVAYANPAAHRMLDAVPERLGAIAPPALPSLVREARRSSGSLTREVEHGVPPRRLVATAGPLAGEDTALLVVDDVTEARRVESMRRDFVAHASHELKTPVAAIRAALETIRRVLDDDPAAARTFAGSAEAAAERLARIVSDLLDLSRLEAEEGHRERIDLSRIVAEEAQRARPLAAEAGIRLEVSVSPAAVEGDPADLALAARNLLDNAIRYTTPGGVVSLGLTVGDRQATLEVADTGAGIPSRELPRIFERFYRVDSGRGRDTGGTGLGLAIVRHVAERHGGRVEVESELGRGSVFRLIIPTP